MLSSQQERWHNAIAGSAAGGLTRITIAPFDLIRIRLQLDKHRNNIWSHVTKVYQTEGGIFGFYRGNIPATYLWVGYAAVQFTVYEQISQYLHNTIGNGNRFDVEDNKNNAAIIAFSSGSLAGITATVFSYPLDICRTNFAASADGPQSMRSFAYQMYQKQGILRGFFAGIGPAIYGIIPYMGFNFLIYETLVNGDRETVSLAGVAGAISGGTSKLLVYPLDTIKKRIQVHAFTSSSLSPSTMKCFSQIIQNESPANLYRGIFPSVVKNTVATSLSFALYTLTLNTIRCIDFQPQLSFRQQEHERQENRKA